MILYEWSSQIVYVRKPLPSGGAHIKDYTSHFPGERAVQSAIQNPYIFLWVYEAEAPLPNFCSHTCFDHILEGGRRLILYVCICSFFLPMYRVALALKWVVGLMWWNYLYLEREGEEESVSIKIYLQGEGLWGASDTDRFFFFFFFLKEGRNSTHCETPWGVTLSSFI